MTRPWHAWTSGQDAYLYEHAYLGAEECTRKLNKRYGTNRTVAAVQKRASIKRITLVKRSYCSECGKPLAKKTRDGLCCVCHERSFFPPASQQRAELLKAMEYTQEELAQISEARRARQRDRQRLCRERKSQRKSQNAVQPR